MLFPDVEGSWRFMVGLHLPLPADNGVLLPSQYSLLPSLFLRSPKTAASFLRAAFRFPSTVLDISASWPATHALAKSVGCERQSPSVATALRQYRENDAGATPPCSARLSLRSPCSAHAGNGS